MSAVKMGSRSRNASGTGERAVGTTVWRRGTDADEPPRRKAPAAPTRGATESSDSSREAKIVETRGQTIDIRGEELTRDLVEWWCMGVMVLTLMAYLVFQTYTYVRLKANPHTRSFTKPLYQKGTMNGKVYLGPKIPVFGFCAQKRFIDYNYRYLFSPQIILTSPAACPFKTHESKCSMEDIRNLGYAFQKQTQTNQTRTNGTTTTSSSGTTTRSPTSSPTQMKVSWECWEEQNDITKSVVNKLWAFDCAGKDNCITIQRALGRSLGGSPFCMRVKGLDLLVYAPPMVEVTTIPPTIGASQFHFANLSEAVALFGRGGISEEKCEGCRGTYRIPDKRSLFAIQAAAQGANSNISLHDISAYIQKYATIETGSTLFTDYNGFQTTCVYSRIIKKYEHIIHLDGTNSFLNYLLQFRPKIFATEEDGTVWQNPGFINWAIIHPQQFEEFPGTPMDKLQYWMYSVNGTGRYAFVNNFLKAGSLAFGKIKSSVHIYVNGSERHEYVANRGFVSPKRDYTTYDQPYNPKGDVGQKSTMWMLRMNGLHHIVTEEYIAMQPTDVIASLGGMYGVVQVGVAALAALILGGFKCSCRGIDFAEWSGLAPHTSTTSEEMAKEMHQWVMSEAGRRTIHKTLNIDRSNDFGDIWYSERNQSREVTTGTIEDQDYEEGVV